jgi:hypothetical protein
MVHDKTMRRLVTGGSLPPGASRQWRRCGWKRAEKHDALRASGTWASPLRQKCPEGRFLANWRRNCTLFWQALSLALEGSRPMGDNTEEFFAYLTQLQAEHQRLHEHLRRIEERWLDCELSQLQQVVTEVIGELVTLRSELASHFEEEESGSFLDEAVSRQPSLSDEARRLESEHGELLQTVDGLILQLKSAESPLGSEAGQDEFRRFVDQLRAHEAAEDRILEDGLGVELD